ncbi:MAG: phage major capsid protein, partial [Nitrosopumilus sp.]
NSFQGLNDMIPPTASRTTGSYGAINRPSAYTDSGNGVFIGDTAGTNGWWGPKYLAGTLTTLEDDLLTDMKKLYNSVHNNQTPPNLMLTTQTIFEAYEEFALDISQIIKDETTRLADLGFEVLRFKGKPVVWSSDITAQHLIMLNTDWIEVVYDPQLWFDMTDWKPQAFEFDRAAQILCALNIITSQPRRHGRIEYV